MRTATVAAFILMFQPFLGKAPVAATPDTQPQKGTQAYLMREVHHELTLVPWYTVFDDLKYSVNGDEVTLSGEVTQPTLKSDAENAVKSIDGVKKVNNEIEVLPLSSLDEQVRRAEYRAIYSQGNLARYGVGALQSIHIIVKGGHVTLEGNVDTQQDKDAAALYAKTVPNVFSVDNHLVVAGSK